MNADHDAGLNNLLALDGLTFFVDEGGSYAVKFVVKPIPATRERPHGLSYSLTLHGPGNERLVGFDNAHAVRPQAGPAGRSRQARDHRHRFGTVRPYEYTNAETLLADFWEQVDRILREKGVLR